MSSETGLLKAVDAALKAFGAPGDWGYGTPIGDALFDLHRARCAAEGAVPEPVATVIDDNQPGWTAIVETKPNVTLMVGTKLYAEPATSTQALAARIAELEAGLRPVAAIHIRANERDDDGIARCEDDSRFTVGHVRRARALLSPQGEADGEGGKDAR